MAEEKQNWVCEDCGMNGTVRYDIKDGVFAVVHAIRDHHETLASRYAPTCHFTLERVRVWNPREMDVYAWNRFVAAIEQRCERKADPHGKGKV